MSDIFSLGTPVCAQLCHSRCTAVAHQCNIYLCMLSWWALCLYNGWQRGNLGILNQPFFTVGILNLGLKLTIWDIWNWESWISYFEIGNLWIWGLKKIRESGRFEVRNLESVSPFFTSLIATNQERARANLSSGLINSGTIFKSIILYLQSDTVCRVIENVER